MKGGRITIETEMIRSLRPFSDLKTPMDTIYDHLPYKKDITLVKESDVRLVSGNIIKQNRLVSEAPITVNTNPLANNKIQKLMESYVNPSFAYTVEDYQEEDLTGNSAESDSISDAPAPIEPENSFLGVDEDEDDYSFLMD